MNVFFLIYQSLLNSFLHYVESDRIECRSISAIETYKVLIIVLQTYYSELVYVVGS